MFIDNTVLFLILGAISLILVVLFAVSANLLIESKQKQKLQLGRMTQVLGGTPHECAHSFGYLSLLSERQRIPDECFGCRIAIDCIKANPKPAEAKTVKQAENPNLRARAETT